MLGPKPTPIRCTSCGATITADVRTVIDAQHDPEGKMEIISGQLNTFDCPNCGVPNTVKTPILYHDAEKELLIAFVPQELGLQRGKNEEKIIGDMLNELTTSLPDEDFRGYMFNPKRSLTFQGLLNQILEADGITQEMLDEQKKRVDVIQTLLETEFENLPDVIQQHDDIIDEAFFGTFTAMAERLMQSGQMQIAQAFGHLQDQLLENSSYGQVLIQRQAEQQAIIEQVTADIEALPETADRKDFLKLLWDYKDYDDKVQALVGMVRPAFDYEMFQMIAGQISKAPADERGNLEALRDRVYELTKSLDQQSQALMQQKLALLQAIAQSDEPETLIQENIYAIDDNFMALLRRNIEEAQKREDTPTFERLQQIYDIIVEALRDVMQPELRFVNDLLNIEDQATLVQEIQKGAPEFGDGLLDMLDAVERVVIMQGQNGVIERIQFIRNEAKKVLS